ncbi:MAG: SDR family NAD(P)-dependent oxidoreductase [Firmicutes bacterium]|nr:SDR family NAD(P)-dependent oxidoreductase [Bacillota bacterium]
MAKKVVVVSGASSGIGLSIANLLTQKGYVVYGLARRTPQGKHEFSFISTDVTDDAAIHQAVATILEKEKRVDALINCAGMGISGAVEYTSKEEFQKIFDVNVYGTFALTKALIPALRETKGMIINIGSVAGVLTIPFQTFYSMTKVAVSTFSEGLRMELKPFGVRVVTVLGDTKTGFTAAREKQQTTDPGYAKRLEKSVKMMEHDEEHGKDPITVAKVCARLLKKKHPPVAVTVGFKYKLFVFLKRLLPSRLVNTILFVMYGK